MTNNSLQDKALETAVAHIRNPEHDPLQAFYDVLRAHLGGYARDVSEVLDGARELRAEPAAHLPLELNPNFSRDFDRADSALIESARLFDALGGEGDQTATASSLLGRHDFHGDGRLAWDGMVSLVEHVLDHERGGADAASLALEMAETSANIAAQSGSSISDLVAGVSAAAMASGQDEAAIPALADKASRIGAKVVEARQAVSLAGHLNREIEAGRRPNFPDPRSGGTEVTGSGVMKDAAIKPQPLKSTNF